MDHAGIEVEIKSGHVLAQDFDFLTRFVEHALDRIGNDRATNPLHGDWRQRVRDQYLSHEGIGLVADHDMPGLGDRLQSSREVHLRALDRMSDTLIA